jgi:hypothetical protein
MHCVALAGLTREWSGWSGLNLTWNFARLQSPSSYDCTQNFSCWYAVQECERNAQLWKMQYKFVPPRTRVTAARLAVARYSAMPAEYEGPTLIRPRRTRQEEPRVLCAVRRVRCSASLRFAFQLSAVFCPLAQRISSWNFMYNHYWMGPVNEQNFRRSFGLTNRTIPVLDTPGANTRGRTPGILPHCCSKLGLTTVQLYEPGLFPGFLIPGAAPLCLHLQGLHLLDHIVVSSLGSHCCSNDLDPHCCDSDLWSHCCCNVCVYTHQWSVFYQQVREGEDSFPDTRIKSV